MRANKSAVIKLSHLVTQILGEHLYSFSTDLAFIVNKRKSLVISLTRLLLFTICSLVILRTVRRPLYLHPFHQKALLALEAH
jgi:Flp pilus assembly protein TadB